MVEESFEELSAVSSFFITYMVGGWVRESEVCFWQAIDRMIQLHGGWEFVQSLLLAPFFSTFFSSVLNFGRHQNYPRPFVVKGKQFTELAFVLK